jgi:biotin operon repressor
MSIRAIDWAFRQDVSPSNAKFVLVKIADNANDEGECWPSQSTIAKHTNLQRQTVNRHIQTLERLGFLKIENREYKGKISNIYHLPLNDIPCLKKGHGTMSQIETLTTRSPRTTKEPVTPSPLLYEIWQAYPKGRRESQDVAYNVIEKAIKKSGLTAEEMLSKVKAFTKCTREIAPRFIKLISSWMNQSCYTLSEEEWNPDEGGFKLNI